MKRIGFVGTPCQINAVRKIQMGLKRFAKVLGFTIGLMCTESFLYEGLMEKEIQEKLGISPGDVKKMNIKGRILVTTKKGQTSSVSLKTAKKYARKKCNLCNDFSAELADISTGGVGMSGWTFTILRTEKGVELFENAEKDGLLETKTIEGEKNAFDLLVRLSKMKRKRTN
jgi:coenzyme F420 hydrogenase subunit beta